MLGGDGGGVGQGEDEGEGEERSRSGARVAGDSSVSSQRFLFFRRLGEVKGDQGINFKGPRAENAASVVRVTLT